MFEPGVTAGQAAQGDLREWLRVASDRPPFDFCYGNRRFSEQRDSWAREGRDLSDQGIERCTTTKWTDGASGLVVEMDSTLLPGLPAVEWVLRLTNRGEGPAAPLHDISALHSTFPKYGAPAVLHRSRGSTAERTDFEPIPYAPTNWRDHEPSPYWTAGEPLDAANVRFCSVGGRSSNGYLPFFDVQTGNRGLTIGIGWSGQWVADVAVGDGDEVLLQAGMPDCHFVLEPGESIRTPRILLCFWRGQLTNAHNAFRQLLLRYHTPSDGDGPVTVPIAASSFAFFPEVSLTTPMATMGTGVTEANQLELLAAYVENDIPIEVFWIDAGWYDNDGTWRGGVGNWYPNPRAFPNGLKPISQAAHAAKKRLLVWFEPERVVVGTEIHRAHPEWLIRLTDDDDSLLFDLGNDDARAWMIDRISSLLRDEGIDILRHDFNMNPLEYWAGNDAPTRRGMTEIRYIEGLYDFWDSLLERHPGLMIDNCASGGRRLDVESISRTVVLTRSDYPFLKIAEPDGSAFERYEPTGLQSHTWAVNRYLPVSGTSTNRTDRYGYRSALSAGMHIAWDPRRPDFPTVEARERLREHLQIRAFFAGDYYPLTAYSVARDVWMAYQFHRADLAAGVVIAFRRSECPYPSASLELSAVERTRNYETKNLDTGEVCVTLGDVFQTLTLTLDQPRSSAVIVYHALPS